MRWMFKWIYISIYGTGLLTITYISSYIAAVLSVSVKEACWDKYPKLVLWSSGNNTQFVQRALSSIPEMAKHSLRLKFLDIQLLQECINFEIKIADKTCNFISLYRSPSQSKDEFESFADNLELNLDSIVHRNPYLIVVLGDFNAQTKGWYPLGKTTYEGTRIDGITSQFGLEQLIHEPTHIIGERSSCIDLIFAYQPNLVVEWGVQSSLH